MGIRNRLGARLILGMICTDYQKGKKMNIFKQSGYREREFYQVNLTQIVFLD